LQERESKDTLLISALAKSTEACSAVVRKVLTKIKKNNALKILEAVKRSSMSVEMYYKVTNLSLQGIIVREDRLRFEIVFLL
jgi:hypothetical protein